MKLIIQFFTITFLFISTAIAQADGIKNNQVEIVNYFTNQSPDVSFIDSLGNFYFTSGDYKSCDAEDLMYSDFQFPFTVSMVDTLNAVHKLYDLKICGLRYLIPYIDKGRNTNYWTAEFYNEYYCQGTDTIGSFNSNFDFGQLLAKINDSGVVEWAVSFVCLDNFGITLLDLDESGNSYVSLNFSDSVLFYSNGDTLSFYADENQQVLIKLDSHGKVIWTKAFSEYRALSINDIVSVNNKIYLCGSYVQDDAVAIYDGGALTTDMFVMCLKSDGSLVWFKNWGGLFDDNCNTISLSKNGQLLVSGFYQDSLLIPLVGKADFISPFYGREKNAFTMKIDTTGNVNSIWAFGLAWYDYIYEPLEDSSGNIHLVGSFTKSFSIPQINDTVRCNNQSGEDVFYLKVSPKGIVLDYHVFGFNGDDRFISPILVDDNKTYFIFQASQSWPKFYIDNQEFMLDEKGNAMLIKIE